MQTKTTWWSQIAGVILFGCLATNIGAQEQHYLPELTTVELAPQLRVEPLSAALYTLKTNRMAAYLENLLIFDDMDTYETMPYVVAFDHNNTMTGPGDIAYTKGLYMQNDVSQFSLLKPGKVLSHPDTQEKLGLEVFIIGSGKVEKFGQPQTLRITSAETNIEINTRIAPLIGIFMPALLDIKYPPTYMRGYILSVQEDRQLAATYSVVIVSLGRRDGLRQGHVLDIVEGDRILPDKNTGLDVHLPSAKVGEVLIYSTCKKISLGIVTYATRCLVLNDVVEVPIQD